MRFRKSYNEKPPSRWNRKDRMEYYLTVYEGGRSIPAKNLTLAVNFIVAVKKGDQTLFKEVLKDGGFIRELSQKVLDCAIDKEEAVAFFRRQGLDLRQLAGEPAPLY